MVSQRPNGLVSLEQVHVRYDPRATGDRALAGVDLTIAPGTFTGVVGPSGAGKTTLLRVLTGALRPSAGRVHRRRGLTVGYVPQVEAIDWSFPVSVADVALMGRPPAHRWPWSTPAERAAVSSMLDRLGLAGLERRHIRELSGGQQQRVFLARALVQEPHILLLDEPFAGVDVTSQELVLGLLDALRARRVTVIVATHDLQLAAERFDQVLLLNRRLLAYGPPAEVFRAELVKAAFGHQALVLDGVVLVDHTRPPAPHSGAVVVDGGAGHPASARPPGTVADTEPIRGGGGA